jgi:hypothetical protein
MHDRKPITRRRAIVGIGGFVGAASAKSLLAGETKDLSMDKTINNPLSKKSAKPPFKGQSQPWPGLANQMEPKPDQWRRELQRIGTFSWAQGTH